MTTRGRLAIDSADHIVVRALDGVSFDICDDARVGLVGFNGAGKSTLLRTIGGIYKPTSGSVELEGSVSSLTDISLGIDSEATGYENIVLRGLMMGLSRREATDLIPEIEEFTELGDYLNMPVSTYSSGMMVRLAFAVSTAIKPEILLMDEWIGAGDERFRQKAEDRLVRTVDRARALLLASHSEQLIRNVCSKAILIDQGQILIYDDADIVMDEYKRLARDPSLRTTFTGGALQHA
ncbi:MAG: ABC transporter ATP-binding protein [Pseudomonadota bacterium]